jgi:hypothetical protein
MPITSASPSSMVYIKMFIVGVMGLLTAACSTSGLSSLLVEGTELHPSLKTRNLKDNPPRHVSRSVVLTNPQYSTDTDFVRAIARSGSQGKLSEEGIRSALYAVYLGQSELGFYGMEAVTADDADRLESTIRKVWAHNKSINRAQIHRSGQTLVVVWTDGVPLEVWEAVNARVAARLTLSVP